MIVYYRLPGTYYVYAIYIGDSRFFLQPIYVDNILIWFSNFINFNSDNRLKEEKNIKAIEIRYSVIDT